MSSPRRVILVAFDGVQPLDLAGPHEVFAGANDWLRHNGLPAAPYELIVAAPSAGPVRSGSGLALVADRALDDPELLGVAAHDGDRAVDTLVVCGGAGVHPLRRDRGAVDAIARLAAASRRVTSVCTGAFALAEAGLLEGRRATTHWASAARLAREFPGVQVDAEPVFVRDGHVWTSAGVTAGIDLALALVEDDHGADAARTVAQWLVMFLRRPGGQRQFSMPLWAAPARRDPIRRVCDRIHGEPGADLSVGALASTAAMSERHFIRLFTQETGRPPGRYVLEARVEVAKRELQASGDGVDVIARRCGLGTAETMRRTFLRLVGVTPSAYRERFHQGHLSAATHIGPADRSAG